MRNHPRYRANVNDPLIKFEVGGCVPSNGYRNEVSIDFYWQLIQSVRSHLQGAFHLACRLHFPIAQLCCHVTTQLAPFPPHPPLLPGGWTPSPALLLGYHVASSIFPSPSFAARWLELCSFLSFMSCTLLVHESLSIRILLFG